MSTFGVSPEREGRAVLPALDNSRHERFAQELAKGSSCDDAYFAAGYSANRGNACRLKANERVRARVAELIGKAADRTGASVETVLRELLAIATADIGQAVEWNGERVTLKDSTSLPPEVRAAIAEVRQGRDGVTIRFHSKTTALETLGRHLGMFKDRIEHSGPNGRPIEASPLDVARRIMFALERGKRELDKHPRGVEKASV